MNVEGSEKGKHCIAAHHFPSVASGISVVMQVLAALMGRGRDPCVGGAYSALAPIIYIDVVNVFSSQARCNAALSAVGNVRMASASVQITML